MMKDKHAPKKQRKDQQDPTSELKCQDKQLTGHGGKIKKKIIGPML